MHTQKIFPFALIKMFGCVQHCATAGAGTGLAQTGPSNYALSGALGFSATSGTHPHVRRREDY